MRCNRHQAAFRLMIVLASLVTLFSTGQSIWAQNKTTIRVWGYGLDDTRAKARVAVFEAANPNIQIEPVGGDLNTQQLLTAVASGDPPEVVNINRSQIGSWAGRGALDSLNDLIARDGYDLAQFYPFTVAQVKYKDNVYGIPQFVNLDLIYMNLDNFQKAGIDPNSIDPGNWQQLQDVAGKLARQEGGKTTQTGFDTKMQDGRLWLGMGKWRRPYQRRWSEGQFQRSESRRSADMGQIRRRCTGW